MYCLFSRTRFVLLTDDVAKLVAECEDLAQRTQQLARFYGEDPMGFDPGVFFAQIIGFSQEFQTASKTHREKEARLKKKQAAEEKKAKDAAAKEAKEKEAAQKAERRKKRDEMLNEQYERDMAAKIDA